MQRAVSISWLLRHPVHSRATKVLELSTREALSLGHDRIGTALLLLGVLGESEGVAMRILLTSGVTPTQIRAAVMARVPAPTKALPDTSRVAPASVQAESVRGARRSGSSYGT
jgi:ATP-dependent Clp protease ATP-binding subunit ClpA